MNERARGRTLIELMISLAIGLVVVIAALTIFSATSTGGKIAQLESRMNENAQIVMSILQQQLRVAGYGSLVANAGVRRTFVGAGVRGCVGGFSNTVTTAFGTLACSNDATKPDSLVVRYEADSRNTVLVSGSPSNCVGEAISSTTASASASGTPLFAVADNRYYVQSVGTPSGGPELYCVGSIGNPGSTTFGTPEPLVEGVEGIYFTYGMAKTSTTSITVAYMTASAIDTQWAATESVDSRWSRVISVRICVVMRSDGFGQEVDRTYKDCTNTTQTGPDLRLRRAYSTTVTLRNRLSTL